MPQQRIRQGKLRWPGAAPEIEPSVYGPTAGIPAIRAGAGVRAVTDPGGGITFTTADDLETKINANPANSIFVHAAGGTLSWTNQVSAGVKHPRIYFLGLAGSTSTVMTGPGDVSQMGIDSSGPDSGSPAGLEVYGGWWKNFGGLTSASWAAPVHGRGNCILADMKTTDCRQASGVSGEQGVGVIRIIHNDIQDCLQYGMNLSGEGRAYPTPPEIGYNIWHNSNAGQFPTADNAGGSKILIDSPWIHHNWVKGNFGSGIWTDYSFGDVLIEENVVEDNTGWGIFYEVGTGATWETPPKQARGIIRHNACIDNCLGASGWFNGVQIDVSCTDGQYNNSPGWEVAWNLIDGTALAMGFINHNCHPFDVKGGIFHDNDLTLRGTGVGRVGGQINNNTTNPNCTRTCADSFAPSSEVRFKSNHYHVPDEFASRWLWSGTNRSWAQWQATGNDAFDSQHPAGTVDEAMPIAP